MVKVHYFGVNMNNNFYKKSTMLTVECGILVNREIVSSKKEDITCGNCKRLIGED